MTPHTKEERMALVAAECEGKEIQAAIIENDWEYKSKGIWQFETHRYRITPELLRECYTNFYDDGNHRSYDSKNIAKNSNCMSALRVAVRMREVREEEE